VGLTGDTGEIAERARDGLDDLTELIGGVAPQRLRVTTLVLQRLERGVDVLGRRAHPVEHRDDRLHLGDRATNGVTVNVPSGERDLRPRQAHRLFPLTVETGDEFVLRAVEAVEDRRQHLRDGIQ